MTRRTLLAAGGASLAGLAAIGSVPTATAQPGEWARAGANRATELAAQLLGPEAERIALLASESAVQGIEGSMADVPEVILAESVCDGIAYGSVIGTAISGMGTPGLEPLEIYGVLEDAHVQNASLGASSAALATAGQYPDENWSADGVFREGQTPRPLPILPDPPLLPEGGVVEDRGPIMRCPTWGASSGALTRVRVNRIRGTEQPPESTHDAAAYGAHHGVTFIAQSGTNSCDLINMESSYAATNYG